MTHISCPQVKSFPNLLRCPDCGRPLRGRNLCPCGFRIRTIDGIPLLLPAGEPALWHDSDSLVARAGRTWKSQLAELGEKRFVARLLKSPRRNSPSQFITPGQLKKARQMSRIACLKKTFPPGHEPDEPIKWILSVIQRIKPRRILDVGSGGGFLLSEIASSNRAGMAVGIDRDYLCLRVASSRIRLHGGGAAVYGADAKRLPFPDSSFDCITSNFAIWHMEGYQTVLAEIARVLRPGGSFVACEMDHNFLIWGASKQANQRLAKSFGLYAKVGSVIRHLGRRGFKSEHLRSRKAGAMSWREIHLRKDA